MQLLGLERLEQDGIASSVGDGLQQHMISPIINFQKTNIQCHSINNNKPFIVCFCC